MVAIGRAQVARVLLVLAGVLAPAILLSVEDVSLTANVALPVAVKMANVWG
jgi:hypothetical protein